MGQKAYKFVDFLASAGAKYWQMLPVGPVADDGSPYRSFSSCAGNPYLIDLESLVKLELLEEKDLDKLNNIGTTKVDFALQHGLKLGVLRKAYDNWKQKKEPAVAGEFEKFTKSQKWLKDYALYMALKTKNADKPWNEWPKDERDYELAYKKKWDAAMKDSIKMQEFWQYLFYGQWKQLRKYAAERRVELIGDVPFYVPEDSVDVWANKEMFLLDGDGRPTSVGGCPPDYFDPEGQRWGNPIYNWPLHQKTKYAWWMERFENTFELFDMVRVDHFRAFYDYWKIPAASPGAKTGTWELGPGLEFFEILKKKHPHAQLIAEDLGGDLHEGVKDLLRDTGLPGITVLQFAFGGDANNPYLPHNGKINQAAYTGTHDNNTLLGWVEQGFEHELAHAQEYLKAPRGVLVEASVKAVLEGVAALAVVPVQDLLGLGAWARMNVPGTPLGNWQWRLSEAEFARLDAKWLHAQLRMYGRG